MIYVRVENSDILVSCEQTLLIATYTLQQNIAIHLNDSALL